jgi:hypothetical protein
MSETKFTPGPWEYVASTEAHGPYVIGTWGGDICDCYTMSNLRDAAVVNGGTSKPIHFQGETADANARLIAAAPDLYEALVALREQVERMFGFPTKPTEIDERVSAAIAKAEGRT